MTWHVQPGELPPLLARIDVKRWASAGDDGTMLMMSRFAPRMSPQATLPRTPGKKSSALRTRTLEQVRTLISALSHSARAVERRTGITNAQLFLLQQLAETDSLAVNDLAARARTQQSTVSIVVARLVRKGLAAKHKSADDGRIAVVTLTPKGRRLVSRAPTPPATALLRAIELLSDRDVRALSRGVQALRGGGDRDAVYGARDRSYSPSTDDGRYKFSYSRHRTCATELDRRK